MPAVASRDGTTPRPSYPYGIKAGGTMTEVFMASVKSSNGA